MLNLPLDSKDRLILIDRPSIHPSIHLQQSNQSVRGNKKLKPEFSRISGGGSMSEMSICSIDFDMSSTENGMLQHKGLPMDMDSVSPMSTI